MTGISLIDVYNFLKEFGLPIALVYVIIRGWLVPLMYYDEMKQDRDWWRNQAIDLLELGEKATSVAERVARHRTTVRKPTAPGETK